MSARDHAPSTSAATPKSAAPEAVHKRLSDVPADLLGNRLTSSLIMLKGDLAKYDVALTHFINRTRAEAAEDRVELLDALGDLIAISAVMKPGSYGDAVLAAAVDAYDKALASSGSTSVAAPVHPPIREAQ